MCLYLEKAYFLNDEFLNDDLEGKGRIFYGNDKTRILEYEK
jgi:hypothetical protein